MKRAIKVGLPAFMTMALIGYASTAIASAITLSYNANLEFNPEAAVGMGGHNAGQLVDELFGPGIGSTGTAGLSGNFTYESTTPAFDQNSRAAGYANAISIAGVRVDSHAVHADIGTIQRYFATSRIGFNATNDGAFCGDESGCDNVGLSFIPQGNLVQVTNDTEFQLPGPGGSTEGSPRDVLSFALGDTEASDDYTPAIETDTFGDVYVDSVNVDLLSDSADGFFDNVSLPGNLSFLDNAALGLSTLSIEFSGPNLAHDIRLTGRLTQVSSANVVAVPEPASFILLAFGLGLICFRLQEFRIGGAKV